MNEILHAFSIGIDSADGAPPDEIQWMPPGTHEIRAKKSDGKPVKRKVVVDAAAAERIAGVLMQAIEAAGKGQEDKPYIDFNHEDGEAAGHVTGISWGGDDPAAGGIRAKVAWTEPGKTAIQGRAYRRFSPSFALDKEGRVIGTSINMGGLVNRAAFKTMAPLWSKQFSPEDQPEADPGGDKHNGGTPPNNKKNMPEEIEKLEQKLAEQATAIEKLNSKLGEITQANSKILALETQVATLQAVTQVQAKAHAEEVVAKAVAAGKIPAQNKELHAKWVESITLDAKNADMLLAMPDNPALRQAVTNPNGGAGNANPEPLSEPEQFVAKHKELVAAGKTPSQALDEITAKTPQLYIAWRKNDLKPAIA